MSKHKFLCPPALNSLIVSSAFQDKIAPMVVKEEGLKELTTRLAGSDLLGHYKTMFFVAHPPPCCFYHWG